MKRAFLAALLCFAVFVPAAQAQIVQTIDHFPSQYVAARRVDIWLPKEYEADKNQRFPVLYMQDGQNVLNDDIARDYISWNAGNTAMDLAAQKKIKPVIIVAVWSTENRYLEYLPEKALENLTNDELKEALEVAKATGASKQEFMGNDYLKFLVGELKVYVDKTYKTLTDAQNTAVCGSSMGGLISMYATFEYPEVFGSAACLSTHWPVLFDENNTNPFDAVSKYMESHMPSSKNHRFYFDQGTKGLDAISLPYQKQVDVLLVNSGYKGNVNYVTKVFEGAEDTEKAWRQRFDEVLLFLFEK
ncbi:alpha/beta hydrolase-fold protein [Flavobacterium rakeshii]|uniref:alpha/beta hydrolase n=1 Tax=Flavobacterium rakeshii TaxID=1038845 RepID=UPI002E7C47F5|nr:alpha/beta hydrolase-fold protein [Flavobacterium rakeshii]MEE1900110.1 alpha/beta hydrolase-fold protein [Flavobacterium rakeshii]